MLKRALSGIVFVAVLLLSTILFEGYLLIGLFFFFALVGTWEYYKIIQDNSSIKVHRYYGLFLSALTYLGLVFESLNLLVDFYFWLIFPFYSIPFLTELFRKNKSPFSNILHTLAPVLYISISFALLVKLGFVQNNELLDIVDYQNNLILSFFFMQWANDTGGYIAGRFFGKRKLFERISPNKTWEGTIGGVILTIIVSIICFNYFQYYSIIVFLGMAIIICSIGSLGDLVQSMLKRSLNVKDSGKLIPGHGGVLDRFDGLMLSSSFVFAWITLWTNL